MLPIYFRRRYTGMRLVDNIYPLSLSSLSAVQCLPVEESSHDGGHQPVVDAGSGRLGQPSVESRQQEVQHHSWGYGRWSPSQRLAG